MMTPELLRLTSTYQRQLAATAARTSSGVERTLLLARPLSDAEASAWLAQVRPLVDAGRLTASSISEGYLSSYGDMVGQPIAPLDSPFDLAMYRNGLTIDEAYMRSIIKARTILSEGRSFMEAMRAAASDAAARADTDSMMAARQRSNDVLSANNVQGYRRVPDANACAFCLLVSTQRYHIRTLMPIHTRCHCTVAPIYGRHDPGRVIATKTYEEITKGKAANVVTHPELGPIVLAA